MSFQLQPDGTLLGCGPDRDYPGRADAEEHWRKINEAISKRLSETPVTSQTSPHLTLHQQASKQIARLEREMAEWIAIRDGAPIDG